ncbi:MAG: hypothetical protein OXC69_03615 [Candidatus Tectomicrobia bacterium]|nr:hypothetical protein [Candidatus Tectomicrobia bacterium]
MRLEAVCRRALALNAYAYKSNESISNHQIPENGSSEIAARRWVTPWFTIHADLEGIEWNRISFGNF